MNFRNQELIKLISFNIANKNESILTEFQKNDNYNSENFIKILLQKSSQFYETIETINSEKKEKFEKIRSKYKELKKNFNEVKFKNN